MLRLKERENFLFIFPTDFFFIGVVRDVGFESCILNFDR